MKGRQLNADTLTFERCNSGRQVGSLLQRDHGLFPALTHPTQAMGMDDLCSICNYLIHEQRAMTKSRSTSNDAKKGSLQAPRQCVNICDHHWTQPCPMEASTNYGFDWQGQFGCFTHFLEISSSQSFWIVSSCVSFSANRLRPRQRLAIAIILDCVSVLRFPVSEQTKT